MNEIILNEVNAAKNGKIRVKHPIYIERNDSRIGDFFAVAASACCDSSENEMVRIYVDVESTNEYLDYLWGIFQREDSGSVLVKTDGETKFPKIANGVFILDCMDSRYQNASERDAAACRLTAFCKHFAENGHGVCFFLAPAPDNCPENVTSLAEREYDAYLLKKEQKTIAENFYLRMETIVRLASSSSALTLLRATNVLGIGFLSSMYDFNLQSLISEMNQFGTISIHQGDQAKYISITSLSTVVNTTLRILCAQRCITHRGQTYNVVSYNTSVLNLKQTIYKAFEKEITLKAEDLVPTAYHYHCLDSAKLAYIFTKSKKKPTYSFPERYKLNELLYRVIRYEQNQPYDITRKLGIYKGRLEIIKALEMELLKHIDRICREHDIAYFATGGTMLGAVRHNSMIPWDDDIDIGLLRKDFEKFRTILPEFLPEGITYEKANGESGSHYHFDRIRLSGTYFSTFYSDKFQIPDGVFIDVLVYDPTSNRPYWQKQHIKMVSMWTRVINVKWVNKVRKSIYPKLTRIALPVMRRISWDWFHNMFDVIAQRYKNKKDSEYVIDTMGLYIKKGALRAEWFNGTVDMPFGDLVIPVPWGYEGCLTHFYGPNWNKMLPVDSRISGHKIARLDLGTYLFDTSLHKEVRKLSIHGELLERTDEEVELTESLQENSDKLDAFDYDDSVSDPEEYSCIGSDESITIEIE